MKLNIAVVGLEPIMTKLHEVPTQALDAINRGLRAGVMVLVREVKSTIYAGHDQGHLEGDTGRLRNSITFEVDASAHTAEVGTNVKYGPIHEFGGIIKPHGHPFLSIPIGSMKGSPREHNDLFFLPVGSNGLLLDRAGVPQYALRREVVIPARPFLGPAMRKKGSEAADKVVKALYKLVGVERGD